MAAQSSLKTIDLQEMFTSAAKLELKVLHAGVECLQVWISQAAKLSNIASDTLQAIQGDKGSVAETARRLTEFGKQNTDVFGDLSSRLSKDYYAELGRLTTAIESKVGRRPRGTKAARRKAPPNMASRRKSGRKPNRASQRKSRRKKTSANA
jgi:hypothetical protein